MLTAKQMAEIAERVRNEPEDDEGGGVLACMPPKPMDPQDLEALVTLLEIASVYLTKDPSTTFTADELISEARAFAGDEVPFDENDMHIVLRNSGFLRRVGGGRYQLK